METITFYSYKGGTGRSLALANAARYLARLGFKVVALDFDLESPGLHYKFSSNPDGKPLPVKVGVVDYLHGFIVGGEVRRPMVDYGLGVPVPGTDKPINLIPAGQVPSVEYWAKLSRINWYDLFYSKNAKGVQIFLELKNHILDEFEPDFLLVDSRTGITEIGGVATTLFADRVICLVLPPIENLEGARAVLRSLKRSRRESGLGDIEIMVALSRLPQMKGSEDERELTDRIRTMMNTEAEDPKDTLSCRDIFVLHSEAALQVRETLRVGSGISPDESILLRDYLRLFASVVPWELIEPQAHKLLQDAKDKIWDDPDAAVKEVEELAESYGRPEIYRELLRFYDVRNFGGALPLKRAQRLWDLSRNSDDPALWLAVSKTFEPKPAWQREKEWYPSLEFIRAVWHGAGKKDPEFGTKLAEAYSYEDRDSVAADVLLEIIKDSGPIATVVSRCISLLDTARRGREADALIDEAKAKLVDEPDFVEAWARHALRHRRKEALLEFTQPVLIDRLKGVSPAVAMRVYIATGLKDQAALAGNAVLREVRERRFSPSLLMELGEAFQSLGRFDEFERVVDERYPDEIVDDLRRHLGMGRRRR
jgi:MinD-like ATPase involved in chromosome partitioning or flagellar assembly